MRRYPVVIEQKGTGYSAFSPDVPGCAAAGDTPEHTRSNFQDALAAHFEAMRHRIIPNAISIKFRASVIADPALIPRSTVVLQVPRTSR